jgi:AcrR family transcriptional regulator
MEHNPQIIEPKEIDTNQTSEQDRFRSVAVAFTGKTSSPTDESGIQQEATQSEKLAPPILGRRERERVQRRREIVSMARQLFASNGFSKTTLDEVARLTEFAKPTLYQYFDNKEHLFYSILEEGYEDLDSIIIKASAAQGNTAQQLRAVCVMFLIYFRKQMDFFLIHRQFQNRLRQTMDNPFHLEISQKFQGIVGGLKQIIYAGVRNQEFRPINELAVCTIFLETISVYTIAFKDGREYRSATEIADEIIEYNLDGISAAKTTI